MSPYCHSIHIATHRLTITCKQNRKRIVQEVPLSESRPGFTPHTFPHRNEAICMCYSDIDEDDLDGLPSILTPAMARILYASTSIPSTICCALANCPAFGWAQHGASAKKTCWTFYGRAEVRPTKHKSCMQFRRRIQLLFCLRQAPCPLCNTHRYSRGTGNKSRCYSPRWRRRSRTYRLPSSIL